MAYQTGTATSCTNLLDTIRIFALSLGWTVNYWGDDPQNAGTQDKWLSLATPGGNYFNVLARDATSIILVRGATGYTANNNRDSQPGQAGDYAQTNGLSGPFAAYYLFGSATYIHVVVEIVTNRFAHFAIGVLEKSGVYTGGEYAVNTYWTYGNTTYQHQPDAPYNSCPWDSWLLSPRSQWYRMDVDGAVNNWYQSYDSGDATSYPLGFMRGNSLVARLFNRSPNYITGQSILPPSIIVGPRPAGGSCIYGTVKDVRPVNITNLNPKQILYIGTDQWMIFPVIRKGYTTQYEPCSGNYGIAYRKVA